MTLCASGFDSRHSPHLYRVNVHGNHRPVVTLSTERSECGEGVAPLLAPARGYLAATYTRYALVSQRQRNRNESPDSGGSNPPKCTEPDWPEQMYPSSKGVGVDSRSRLNVFPPMRERDTVG